MKAYLTKSGIKVLDRPGNSLGLNPIESCWQIMGTEIPPKKPATKTELQESILRAWFHDSGRDYNQKLISSKPDRCKAVIAKVGYFSPATLVPLLFQTLTISVLLSKYL